MTPAFLGLGSNLGDRVRHLTEAIRHLSAVEGVRVTALSPVYETKPVGRSKPAPRPGCSRTTSRSR